MFSVYFPQEPGEYAVTYFIGGLGGYAPVEFYSIFMSKIASHGFFVFGVDYAWPVSNDSVVTEDVNKYFEELSFVSGKVYLFISRDTLMMIVMSLFSCFGEIL